MKNSYFYITTTLPYVNAAPHIGFALEIVQADVIARYRRLLGDDVFFNFGVDEHGQKIWQKALENKVTPQKYVDEYAQKFTVLKEKLNLTYDAFIRTTDAKHVEATQEMWRRCASTGDIYKKEYEIKYCVGCELEKTDSELVDSVCPLHIGTPLEIRQEENYFFKLSNYQEKLTELYNRTDFVVPDYRLNEIRSLMADKGLQDFSISRLKKKMPWGIAVPGDDAHVMYVWFDALVNYISTLGWPKNEEMFSKFWTGKHNCVQVAGKDQMRQQTAMWQAMLMSAKLPTTGRIFIHGFINSGGQKMSKSLGNVVDPIALVDEYGVDALRCFLLQYIHPTEDSNFTMEKFKEVYNASLANGLGNLTARIMQLAETHLEAPVPVCPIEYPQEYKDFLDKFEMKFAMDYIFSLVQALDHIITRTEPFKVVRVDLERGCGLITELVVELTVIAHLLRPFLPDTSKKIIEAIIANKKPETLFPRKD